MKIVVRSGFGVLLLAACALLLGCATAKPFSVKDVIGFHVPEKSEELYGTWTNTAYETEGAKDSVKDPKVVIHETGFLESFRSISLGETNDTGVMTIVKKWRHGQDIWYITFYRSTLGSDTFNLARLSENASMMESFWVSASLAGQEETLTEENMSPDHPHYKVYYRQAAP